MNPYPFASLNHLTVPVAIEKHLLLPTNSRTVDGRLVPTRYSLCGDQSVADPGAQPLNLASGSLENLLGPGQVGLVDDDLGRRHSAVGAGAHLRRAVKAFDAARAQEPADDLGLGLVLHSRQCDHAHPANNALMPRYVALL